MDDEVRDEIEALRAIYCDELQVEFRGKNDAEAIIGIDLYPATGDVKEEQLIRIRLEIDVPYGYPSEKPRVRLKNPRGLSDESVMDILRTCEEKIASQLGEAVLYDLIHVVTESLTNKNVPTGVCCICLEGFESASCAVVKTNCFHHLHDPCLRRYVRATAKRIKEEEEEWLRLNPYDHKLKQKNQLQCPVCREVLPDSCQKAVEESEEVRSALLPIDEDDKAAVRYIPDPEKQAYWDKMRKIFEKQLAQGGIIDESAEESRRLVVVSNCTRDIQVRKKSEEGRNQSKGPGPRRKFSRKP